MKTKPKLIKLSELEYNETLTIALVEKDEKLRNIFADELRLPFSLLITLSAQDKLTNEDTKSLLRSIFDDVIVTQSELIRKYKELAHTNNITLSEVKTAEIITLDEPSVPTVVEEVPEKTAEIIADKSKVSKPKKEKELPRRYGREAILKDITNQGGKPTTVQLTALETNELKNIWVNLSSRLIRDMFSDKIKLSDEDYRNIRATIKIVKNKIIPILKKK